MRPGWPKSRWAIFTRTSKISTAAPCRFLWIFNQTVGQSYASMSRSFWKATTSSCRTRTNSLCSDLSKYAQQWTWGPYSPLISSIKLLPCPKTCSLRYPKTMTGSLSTVGFSIHPLVARETISTTMKWMLTMCKKTKELNLRIKKTHRLRRTRRSWSCQPNQRKKIKSGHKLPANRSSKLVARLHRTLRVIPKSKRRSCQSHQRKVIKMQILLLWTMQMKERPMNRHQQSIANNLRNKNSRHFVV